MSELTISEKLAAIMGKSCKSKEEIDLLCAIYEEQIQAMNDTDYPQHFRDELKADMALIDDEIERDYLRFCL